ncbi:MAG: CoA transferase [Clostridia bacterium]|nr:CoA transferase [Clostridia bacterium]
MGTLDGIKILGFTHFAQAPYALQMLGDLGADVINVERPGLGDFNRTFLTEESLGGESPFFLALNRNKRSLAIDLKNIAAKEVIYKLYETIDVVVTNFRPGVLEKLGLGYEDAKKINPNIIFAEAVGYGIDGPYAKLPGQDLLAQSLSGYTSIVGTEGQPGTGGIYVADMYSGSMLVIGILSALIKKNNGGGGQRVTINLLDSAVNMQMQELGYYLNTGKLPKKPKRHCGHILQESPYGIYQTMNGFMAIATTAAERAPELGEILEIANLGELMPDKPTMLKNRDDLFELLQAKILKKSTEYWLERLQAAGFWCAKVNTYPEVPEDPQIKYNKIIKEIEHPKAGKIKVIGTPIRFSETPADIRRVPPQLGEHNMEIFHELGFSDDEIQSFKENSLF